MAQGIRAEELAGLLWPQEGASAASSYFTRAPVLQTSGTGLSVSLRGSESATPCSRLESYAPAVGDVALVLVMPTGCIALGAIA